MNDEAHIRLIDVDALVVGPDEILIVKGDFGPDGAMAAGLAEMFDSLGIGPRSLILNVPPSRPLEFTKVSKEGA